MNDYFQKITENLYGFLVWDKSWNSFNNCYVLINGNDVILIDSGKEEHFECLETAIKSIGIEKSEITNFIATHGHKDHIGGIRFMNGVEGYIHREDLELLPENIRKKINPSLPNSGKVLNNFECVLLGHHTKGSIILYHRKSKALFCGDHISFFGEPLDGNEVVGEGKLVREKFKDFLSEWSGNNEMKKQHNFDSFIHGLREMNKFDIEYLCTGHGAILKGGINEYITELLEFEKKRYT